MYTRTDADYGKKVEEKKAFPLIDSEGEVEQVVEVVADITEKRKAEENMEKHLRELEIFHEASFGREERIIELKQEINKLCDELKKPRPY